jgi:phosphoglycolate phosphatase
MSRRFQLVLFDLDGTLVDSAPGIHEAGVVAATAVGAPVPDLEFVRNAIGRGIDRLLHRVCSARMDGGVEPSVHQEARRAFDAAYARTCLTGTRLREGVEDTLATLRGEGRRLVVATNKPRSPAVQVLERLGLDARTDGLVCPEDAGVVKPDPAFVRHAAGGLGLDHVLLVGDSSIDAATALAAGIPFVAIRGGYDEGRDIADHEPPPDRLTTSPRDVPAAIRSLEG